MTTVIVICHAVRTRQDATVFNSKNFPQFSTLTGCDGDLVRWFDCHVREVNAKWLKIKWEREKKNNNNKSR